MFLVGNFTPPGRPYGQVCDELARQLAGAGWRVRTTSTRAGKVAKLADMVRTAWACRRDYRVAQVDLFSGPAFIWAEAACWTLRRAGKPYVLTLHGGHLPEFAARHPGRVRRLLHSAAAITAPSGYLLERMRPYAPEIRLLPNPIDLGSYPYRHRERPAPRLVWLRAFHAIYNPTLAIRALAELGDLGPGAELTMIGPDKGDGSLEAVRAAVDRAGLGARVHLLGGVAKAEVPRALDRGDIFLNTTGVDNTPISVLEALACGLPVVSTNVGGLPYLVEDGTDALLVPPDDPGAMARAIRRIVTEPGLAARLSAAGRARAGRHDWSAVLPQWQDLLQGIDKAVSHE